MENTIIKERPYLLPKKSKMFLSYKGRNIEVIYPSCDTSFIDRFYPYFTFNELSILTQIRNLGLEGIYIDGGSCIGIHTLYYKEFTKATKIYSYEPNPEVYSCLLDNIASYKDIIPINKALGRVNGKGNMYNFDDCTYEQYSLIKNDYNTLKLEVEIESLDTTVLPNIPEGEKVVFIKLDLEGYEYEALLGAFDLIKTHLPVVYTEIFRKNKLYKHIQEFFNQLGYEIMYSSGEHFLWRLKHTSLSTKEEQKNIEEYEAYISSTSKKELLSVFLRNISDAGGYVTNSLHKESLSTLSYLSEANLENPLFGFDTNQTSLDFGIKNFNVLKLKQGTHLFKSNLLEAMYQFSDLNISVLDLHIKNDAVLYTLIEHLDFILYKIKEEGLLTLTFYMSTLESPSLIQTLLDKLEEEYLIVKQDPNTSRYFYTSTGSDLQKTYYIYL